MSTNRISYSRWLYAVEMLHRLREILGSWTEVSRAVLDEGDNPGWAKEASKYKYNVNEEHIRAMEKLLAPDKQEGRGGPSGTKLSGDQKKRYKEILNELFDRYGWTNMMIGDALGISPTSVSKSRKEGRGTVERLTLAQQILDTVQRPAPTPATEPEPAEEEADEIEHEEFFLKVDEAMEHAVDLRDTLDSLTHGVPQVVAFAFKQMYLDVERIIKGLEINGEDQEG